MLLYVAVIGFILYLIHALLYPERY
ncbi:potassium-transporting ATPase subunit F [Macrococcoides caseolyticum]|nr:potassium-transporting ATPase subunit F [Macrococcus caseolyticus]RAK45865.1 hypothetical protein C7R57_06000 [Macrococcus caseolyticus subsp. caseolyticus]QQB06732.1 potassium-transporting ATPase subunit F [Macrococcus caseolyticus]QYA36398.1 potassium-transporting ATPase subunit F [Macrococcus caseolyticus]QYA41032.1 potassium-transporting ATPase subunit F [Macrococcus caseolyticus]